MQSKDKAPYTEPQALQNDEASNPIVTAETVSRPSQSRIGATQPFVSKFKTGDLARGHARGDIMTSGPLTIAGLPRLEWRDGSPCDTGQLPRIRKQVLLPERTGER